MDIYLNMVTIYSVCSYNYMIFSQNQDTLWIILRSYTTLVYLVDDGDEPICQTNLIQVKSAMAHSIVYFPYMHSLSMFTMIMSLRQLVTILHCTTHRTASATCHVTGVICAFYFSRIDFLLMDISVSLGKFWYYTIDINADFGLLSLFFWHNTMGTCIYIHICKRVFKLEFMCWSEAYTQFKWDTHAFQRSTF
jgi:hypothetical protein